MLVTTHAALGAMIGLHTKTPMRAVTIGAASHLLLDSIPHWGDSDHGNFLKVARVDGISLLAAAALLLTCTPTAKRKTVAAGIAGSVGFDMDKPVKHFFKVNLFPRPLRKVLMGVQQGKEEPHRLPYEIAVAASMTGVALMLLRRKNFSTQPDRTAATLKPQPK